MTQWDIYQDTLITKMSTVKERILKVAGGKQLVMYKGNPIRLSADFLAETLQARWEWHDIIKKLKGK